MCYWNLIVKFPPVWLYIYNYNYDTIYCPYILEVRFTLYFLCSKYNCRFDVLENFQVPSDYSTMYVNVTCFSPEPPTVFIFLVPLIFSVTLIFRLCGHSVWSIHYYGYV
jgi:hypothetical protein